MLKLLIFSILCSINLSMKITKLENKPLALFDVGVMKVKIGTLKVIHTIDISQISHSLQEIINKTKYRINNTLIEEEIREISNLISRIRPYTFTRYRRWDLIGKAYKWLAGIPDADDLRFIQGTLKDLSNSNNLQIKVNQEITDKVNEIVKAINKTPLTSNSELATNLDLIHLTTQLKQLKDSIEAIQEAVALAKRQIVSHKLLTADEIHLLANTLMKTGVHLHIPEQVLNFVTPTVVIERNILNYILSVPKIKTTTYRVYRVETISLHNEILDLPSSTFATKFPEIYAIHNNCKKFFDFHLCNRNEIQPIPKDECIWRLFFNGKATCTFKKSETKEENLVEISPSIILLREQQRTLIQDNNISWNVTGTLVIEYQNETIKINGKEFTNRILHTSHHKSIFKPLWQPVIESNKIETLNISEIKQINLESPDTQPFWPYSTASLIIICIVIVIGLTNRR